MEGFFTVKTEARKICIFNGNIGVYIVAVWY